MYHKISDKISNLLENERQQFKQNITESLSKNQQSLTLDYETEAILNNSDSPFKRYFNSFANGQTLNNYISSKTEYVSPEEVVIGSELSTSGNRNVVYYVPLLKTLRKLFSHEDLFGSIVEGPRISPANVNKNFSDGSVFSDNELFQKHPKSIQIIFYPDEFQIANALGNKTHKYKIASFYYVLGNLSAKYRAKLKDVHLAILCEASLMKTHSYSAILRPFLDDVKILETRFGDRI